MLRHGWNTKTSRSVKNPDKKDHILSHSIYMKRQIYRAKKKKTDEGLPGGGSRNKEWLRMSKKFSFEDAGNVLKLDSGDSNTTRQL